MWAALGDGLNMRTLWTDTPYAMQRVAGLFDAGEIAAEERDDLAHFVEHGWLVWRGAIEADLIDRFACRYPQPSQAPEEVPYDQSPQ